MLMLMRLLNSIPRYLKESLCASGTLPTLNTGTFEQDELK